MSPATQAVPPVPSDQSADSLLGRFVFQKFERFARFAFVFAIFAFPIGMVFGFFARDFVSGS